MDRTFARRSSAWQESGVILSLATAIGIWIAVVFAVAAPLGNAIARLEAPPTDAMLACATPGESAPASAARADVAPAEVTPMPAHVIASAAKSPRSDESCP